MRGEHGRPDPERPRDRHKKEHANAKRKKIDKFSKGNSRLGGGKEKGYEIKNQVPKGRGISPRAKEYRFGRGDAYWDVPRLRNKESANESERPKKRE